MKEIIKIENLHKRFNNLHVLKGVNLTVHQSETIVIIGSSGSGKSTLLRCLNFLEIPSEGRIFIDGNLIGKINKRKNIESLIYKESELCKINLRDQLKHSLLNLTSLG